MALSPFQLEFGLTVPALRIGLPPNSALRRMEGLVADSDKGFESLSYLGGQVCYGKIRASSGKERMPPEGLAEFLSDPTQWWDNRRTKEMLQNPDFEQEKSKVGLWLKDSQSSVWADSQLPNWDDGMERSPESVHTSGTLGRLVDHESHLEAGMCGKLLEYGRITDAVDALNVLVQRGCHVPNNLFYRILKRCIAQKDLVLGRRIHALTIRSGYEGDAFLATHLIGLYASHGRLEEAMRVFTQVPTPSSYNWATIIFAYARHQQAPQAILLYRQMRESTVKPTCRIYGAVLKACATAGDLIAGKEVHAHILASDGEPDMFVQTGLLDMYAKCGSLEDARRLFDRLPERDVVTWTAMIAGYTQQGMGQEALNLYNSMQQEGLTPPDAVTYVCLLQACASVGVGALLQGKQLHTQIAERGLQDDVVVAGSLVNMYAKCGSTEDARREFDRRPQRSVVTWTAMIACYVQQGMGQDALSIYDSMQQEGFTPPDTVTFVCLLQACASVGDAGLHQGKHLHAQIEELGLQDDVILGGSLVNMYAKCGSSGDARGVFDRLGDRNVVTWTAMIAGYAEQGMGQEALDIYTSMQQQGITPNSVTFVCLLQACSIVAALALGKELHAQIDERGLQADLVVGAALVNMYAKCGSMYDAQEVFDSLPERPSGAWGALITGYSRQGDSEVVFDLLDRMKLEGVQPNDITFLSVLTVCSHVGLVDKGRNYFEAMKSDHSVSPTVEHYTCMMDLLGRAGHLEEALQMAKTMPFPASVAVWRTLLGACQKWNNVEIGQQAFEFAVSVDATDAASYVLMSNIYSSAQMWEKAKETQARRVKSGAMKKPGQSWWTDMGGMVHRIIVGDKKHPEREDIYAGLEQLVPKIKKEEHVLHARSS